MATPKGSRRRRLQFVDDQQNPTTADGTSDSELVAQHAAAFTALVANGNQSAVYDSLEQMNPEQLRSLAIALATPGNTTVDSTENVSDEVADVGPDGICAIAIASAAQAFGTTPDAVLSADRHRAVTDARAVAMTAARRGGLTLTSIAAAFGKDHTSVMYAQTKVANTPRLNAVCTRVVDQLAAHFAEPLSVPAAAGEPRRANGRSPTLQLAALDQVSTDTTRHHQDDDSQRIDVLATPPR